MIRIQEHYVRRRRAKAKPARRRHRLRRSGSRRRSTSGHKVGIVTHGVVSGTELVFFFFCGGCLNASAISPNPAGHRHSIAVAQYRLNWPNSINGVGTGQGFCIGSKAAKRLPRAAVRKSMRGGSHLIASFGLTAESRVKLFPNVRSIQAASNTGGGKFWVWGRNFVHC